MIGRTISHYRILAKVGEGAMGEVYKAEDLELKRTVALKFLSRETLDQDAVKARLIREAQAAASLDHPHICAVHGIHQENAETFIAMAYIDGPSLADKIKERPLPLDEALQIAIQIAEGLQEAHEHGVVHRDIKPQNIMLTAKGQVKIMDFGLASLTGRSRLTKSGTTLGTPAYMAPEQIEAKKVDRRADMWALGCVLYEMLTQRTPFDADYEQAIAYGILNEEPEPVTAQRAGLPTEIDRVIGKALSKDTNQRYQHADDILVDLRRLRSEPVARLETAPALAGSDPVASWALSEYKPWLRYTAVGLIAAAVGASVTLWVVDSGTKGSASTRRFSFTPSSFEAEASPAAAAVISPDGGHIVYVSNEEPTRLWLRSLDNEQARPLIGSEGALGRPFWSADSRWIAYFVGTELKKIGLDGQPPTALCTADRELSSRGGTWDPLEDQILIGSTGNIETVSARGGVLSPFFESPIPGLRPINRRPYSLPARASARAMLIDVGTVTRTDLHLLNLDTGELKKLAEGSHGVYSPSGHIIYEAHAAGSGLWALPFSLGTLEATGDPFPIAEGVGSPSVADDGTLVAVDLFDQGRQRIVWLDRHGRKVGEIGGSQFRIFRPALSPDGRRVAVELQQNSGDAGDIWVIDVDRGIPQRLTYDETRDTFPSWSPDGDWVAFRSDRGGQRDLWLVRADGEGEPRPLTRTANDHEYSSTWSPDGRRLLYVVGNEGPPDIWMLTLDEDQEFSDPKPFLESPFYETAPSISPNGRWVAYVSNETGRVEVFMSGFPDGTRSRRISNTGGLWPQWSSDGAELFYVAGDSAIEAVRVDPQTGTTTQQAERLFESENHANGTVAPLYGVTADGRFIGIEDIQESEPVNSSIRVVQNWYEEFRDRK